MPDRDLSSLSKELTQTLVDVENKIKFLKNLAKKRKLNSPNEPAANAYNIIDILKDYVKYNIKLIIYTAHLQSINTNAINPSNFIIILKENIIQTIKLKK